MSSLEESVTRSLQCPICLELLKEPKLLSCAHTFCLQCISLISDTRGKNNPVPCPLCREETTVPDGGPSSLQTNLQVKTLVDDVAECKQCCNICPPEKKAEAICYCQDCKTYMCSACLRKHGDWRPNASHQVVTVEDMKKGKVVLKKKVLCQEHKVGEGEYECTDICITCKKVICIRCRMLDHEKQGHMVQSTVDYTAGAVKSINSLQDKAKEKVKSVTSHIAFAKNQKKEVVDHINKVKAEISTVHDKYVAQLNERKSLLHKQCDAEMERLLQQLDNVKSVGECLISSIESASNLVDYSLRAPLDGNIVTIRDVLCDGLEAILAEDEPDYEDVTEMSRRAKVLKFRPNTNRYELDLGHCGDIKWKLLRDVDLPQKDSMNNLAALPDGRLAVGSNQTGILIYSSDGQLEETVLRHVGVNELGVLSDSRFIVLDTVNKLLLYDKNWKRVNVNFETLSMEKGGFGSLAVDGDDNIFVSYRTTKNIHVFTPAGGKAVREISCGKYVPYRVFALKKGNMLLLSDPMSARVVDQTGVTRFKLRTFEDCFIYPVVCADDSIIVARLDHIDGFVTIKQYSRELKYVKDFISNYSISIPKRKWCNVQRFTTGEIAFCTVDKLYIFYDSPSEYRFPKQDMASTKHL